jgi:serpin B
VRTRTAAVALALAVTGCGSATTAAPLATQLVGNVETLQPGTLTAQDVSASQTAFGLSLMAHVCGKDGPNTLISPASAADALGLLDAAAAGSTAKAMARLLHLPVWGPAVVSAVHDHHDALAALGTGTGDTLRTSNRVWPAVSIHPTAAYLDDVRTAYDAQLKTLNFDKQAQRSTDTINAQVSKDTDGLIPKLFDSALDPSTTAVLTNAMVLKALWSTPFTAQQALSPFTTASDKPSKVTQMDSNTLTAYTSAAGWQASQLPYVSGTLAAVAILPPKAAKACTLPTATQLATLIGTSTGLASVTMPRLHLDQTHDLRATLASMGLPITDGDYAGLGSSDVSDVVQKDVLKVDELGTVAAAATGIAMAAASASPLTPPHRLTFDRPYLLLLEDTATHTPLFLASIGDPASS